MFFSVLIPDLQVIAHSHWEGEGLDSECKLRILTNQEDTRLLLPVLPVEEAKQCEKHISVLRETSVDPSVEIGGLAALSLSNFIANYANHATSYQHIPAACELIGFYEPPAGRSPQEGIILWSDLDVFYHVAITNSRKQAKRIIQGFDWLETGRQNRLIAKIDKWNSQEVSQKSECQIHGVPAKLLCRACDVSRILRQTSREF